MIKPGHLTLVGAAAFLAFVVILMPAASLLSFANLPAGLTYGGVDGSVWNMRLTNVVFRGRLIGTVYLNPDIAMVFGSPGGSVRVEGPTVNSSFDFSSGAGLTIRNLQATAQLNGRLASQVYAGAARVLNAATNFNAAGQCLSAAGDLRTNAFEDMFAALGMTREPVIAPLLCRDGALLVDFSRMFSGESLEATASLEGANSVMLRVLLRFDDEAAIPEQMIDWLEANGFVSTAGGWQTSTRLSL